jgi:hypothetical protein
VKLDTLLLRLFQFYLNLKSQSAVVRFWANGVVEIFDVAGCCIEQCKFRLVCACYHQAAGRINNACGSIEFSGGENWMTPGYFSTPRDLNYRWDPGVTFQAIASPPDPLNFKTRPTYSFLSPNTGEPPGAEVH